MKDVSLPTQPLPDLEDFAADFQRETQRRLLELKLREAALQKQRQEMDAKVSAERAVAAAELVKLRKVGDAVVVELGAQKRTVARQAQEISDLQAQVQRAQTELRQFRESADQFRAAADRRIRAAETAATEFRTRAARAQQHAQMATQLLAKERRAFQGWLAQHRELESALRRERAASAEKESTTQAEAHRQLRASQTETFKLRERLTQTETKLREGDDAIRRLTLEMRRDRDGIANAQNQALALQAEIAQLKRELSQARETVAQAQSQGLATQAELQKARDGSHQQQGQMLTLQSELQRARDLVGQLQSQNLSLQTALNQTRQDLQAQAHHQALRELITQVKDELVEARTAPAAAPVVEWDAQAAERRVDLAQDLAAGPEQFFAPKIRN